MNALNLLGFLASFVLGCVVVYVFKPFLGTYAAKKGENLATKEDIAELTKIAEGIRAKISDVVWDRQEQWKLRRDAIIEVMRDISSVRRALADVHGTFFSGHYTLPPTDEQKKKLAQFDEHFSRLFCSKFVVEIVTGEELTRSLDEFQNCVSDIFKNTINGRNAPLEGVSTKKELAEKQMRRFKLHEKNSGSGVEIICRWFELTTDN
jgi:hypothetical protein